jgi:hypothetical protein
MTPDQETELFATLKRLDRNVTLAVKGLQLVCSELGIRKQLAELLTEIDSETAGDDSECGILQRDTEPAPAPIIAEAPNGK